MSPRAAPADPLSTGSVRPLRPNPNVTPSNPMGVVGFDGPPGGTTSVIGDDGPLPPGSPAAKPPDAPFAPAVRRRPGHPWRGRPARDVFAGDPLTRHAAAG